MDNIYRNQFTLTGSGHKIESMLECIIDIIKSIFTPDYQVKKDYLYIQTHCKEEYNQWQNEYRQVISFEDGFPEYKFNPEKASHTFNVEGRNVTLSIIEGGSILF